MNLRLIPVYLLAAMVGLPACDGEGPPRNVPTPEFDARAVFESMTPTSGDDAERSGEFDDRIEAMMADDDGGADSPTHSVQTIAIGGSLVSEIPDDFESWKWSRSGDLTLISYAPPGEVSQAIVVINGAGTRGHARQMRRFLGDIDPTLGDGFDMASLMRAADIGSLTLPTAEGSSGEGLDMNELLDTLAGGSTLTGGRGLGYESHRDSFSGWRWLGENRGEVFLRLATSDGQWGPQPETPPGVSPGALQQVLERAAETSGTTLPAGAFDIDQATDNERPNLVGLQVQQLRRARMVFGELDDGSGQRLHIAILCTTEPTCPVAQEFVEFLEGIRTAESSPSGRQTDFDEHIGELGLEL